MKIKKKNNKGLETFLHNFEQKNLTKLWKKFEWIILKKI